MAKLMPQRRRNVTDDAERVEAEAIRRRYREALDDGMGRDEAVAYANGWPDVRRAGPVTPPAAAGGPETDATRAAVPIPDNWNELPWAALRKLAASVSPSPIVNRVDAVAAVEAELARRAAPVAAETDGGA